ncbi:hypothetical protein PCL_12333 [Purpureocillium lilacinum]|uniref:Uncharacterized protein n=1 Tax=Purpureocillium lilacinum TaxID=33203 RepID=A0A2U3E8X8_PURLI|nr:hypothetical protein PCL_12333 [Purpureocillium lilacinum]
MPRGALSAALCELSYMVPSPGDAGSSVKHLAVARVHMRVRLWHSRRTAVPRREARPKQPDRAPPPAAKSGKGAAPTSLKTLRAADGPQSQHRTPFALNAPAAGPKSEFCLFLGRLVAVKLPLVGPRRELVNGVGATTGGGGLSPGHGGSRESQALLLEIRRGLRRALEFETATGSSQQEARPVKGIRYWHSYEHLADLMQTETPARRKKWHHFAPCFLGCGTAPGCRERLIVRGALDEGRAGGSLETGVDDGDEQKVPTCPEAQTPRQPNATRLSVSDR